MIKKLIFLIAFLPSMVYCQSGITFDIEELSKPEKVVEQMSSKEIYQNLIYPNFRRAINSWGDWNIFVSDKIYDELPCNIVAKSKIPDSLVNYGFHSFFNGIYEAYAHHRPFVLTPDMIWLLISQGFSQHVANNSEKLRHYFVDFKDKKTLVVRNDSIILDNPNSPWESVFPEFTKQIAVYTGYEIINALSCNFTTSTPTTKVASEITIMKAMEPYFEYKVCYAVCGIPKVTLEGTPEDWQKVLDKANYIRKYELDWWIDQIEPLLEEFVDASKGDISKRFWRNMFKYHEEKGYGNPKRIDGWIVKFFPYDKDGKRNNFKKIYSSANFPEEVVKVTLKYEKENLNGPNDTTSLELWAGFVGLEQNSSTFALRPHIAWMIRKKDYGDKEFDKWVQKKSLQTDVDTTDLEIKDAGNQSIRLRVNTIPKSILRYPQIEYLLINFLGEIIIPDELANVKIKDLSLTGKISDAEIERLCKLFTETHLHINGKFVNLKTHSR